VLRRSALGEGTADKAVEVFALAGRQGREGGFENRAGHFVTFAKGSLATLGEPELSDIDAWRD
jgi:hypothetical protein